MSTATYQLLASCARSECASIAYDQVARQAANFVAWDSLPAQAEAHGLGPLLYTYLQAAGVPLPAGVKRALQGLFLRHRHANQLRTRVLIEILTTFQAAGIEALVLKGAALAHLLYPQPGLRPMRDLDLLVKKVDARQAQRLLAGLGFVAPLPPGSTLPGKHLAAASRLTEGLTVSVEIHHNLFSNDAPASLALENLTGPPRPLPFNDLTAYTLGHEDMLWHLCRHASMLGQPHRLIWVADIVGWAEHFVGEIDWSRLKRQYPHVLSTLSLFHFITPLSAALRERATLKIGPMPQGVGLEFQGWPRWSLANQRAKGCRRILSDSFLPPEWSLRLYYGLGSASPLFWHRWLIHPLRILRWAGQLLLERASNRPFQNNVSKAVEAN